MHTSLARVWGAISLSSFRSIQSFVCLRKNSRTFSSVKYNSAEIELVDVHCHLLHERFRGEEGDVAKLCVAAGIGKIIINGLNPQNNKEIVSFCRDFPIRNTIYAACGIYPIDACSSAIWKNKSEWKAPYDPPEDFSSEAIEAELQNIDTLAANGQIIAIGECGLDRHYIDLPETNLEQERVLRRLMQIAKVRHLPIILHSRKAEQRVFEMLLEENVEKALFHCFCGKMKLAKSIAAAGYYLSVPCGAIADLPTNQFRKLVDFIPIERLLTETDSPYLGPDKGVRNDPRSVIRGVELIASIKKMDMHDLKARIRSNFGNLFGV